MLDYTKQSARSERGATVVEASVYVAILAVIAVPLIMVTLTVSRASAEGNLVTRIQERNRAIIQRIIEDYRPSLAGTTTVSPDGKVLRFTSLGGFAGVTALPGPWIRYEIRLAPSGAPNEAILVRVNESTGEQVTLTGSLRTDSTFAANGTGVDIAFTTFGTAQGSSKESDVKRAITMQPQN